MIGWYQAKLARRPILVQAVTSAVLFGTGDSLAQQAVERRGIQKHDFARTGRMVLYGGAFFGPLAHHWFKFLQARIRLSTPTRTTIARVAADQLAFSPANLLCFLSTMSYLEGASVKERLRSTYKKGMMANWTVWPWVQLANFRLVPLEHRLLVVNVVALGWNCYLSYLNGQGSASSTKGD